MRKIGLIMLIGFVITLMCNISFAGTKVKLTWAPNTESDLAGYRIYQRVGETAYDMQTPINNIPVGTEEYIISDLPDNKYHWVLTAYDLAGNESDPCVEVGGNFDSPPGCVNGFSYEILE